MDILVIAGFLGSGKTTLLQSIAKEFAQDSSRKMAIIENEVGKVGIDGAFLKEEGLTVKELYSGCICCTMRIDLINTLLELEREYAPDLVILEPSGVAGPKQVLQSLNGYGGEINSKKILTIIDALRFQAIMDKSIPLANDGIEIADIAVINKIDQIGKPEIEKITAHIASLQPHAKIIPVSGLNGTNVDSLLEEVTSLIQSQAENSPAKEIGEYEEPKLPQAIAHANEFELIFNTAIPKDIISEKLNLVISRLAASFKTAGCSMLGHLKAILKPHGHGYLLVSATDFTTQPQQKGALPESLTKAKLTINAIGYDISREMLQNLIRFEMELFSIEGYDICVTVAQDN